MKRVALVSFAAMAVLAGCLFPSFDDLKSNGAGPKGDDDDASEKDGGSSTSSSSGQSSTSSSSSSSGSTTSSGGPDAAADTGGTKTAQTIACSDKTCDATTSFCCGKISGGAECRPKGGATSGCDSTLACDGAQDCPAGQTCCQNSFGGNDAVCKASCGQGYTFCQPEAPMCPASEPSCSGDHIGIFGASPKSCN